MGDGRERKRTESFTLPLISVLCACIVLFYNEYCMLFLKQCKKESQNKTKICYIIKKKKREETKAIPSHFFKGLL